MFILFISDDRMTLLTAWHIIYTVLYIRGTSGVERRTVVSRRRYRGYRDFSEELKTSAMEFSYVKANSLTVEFEEIISIRFAVPRPDIIRSQKGWHDCGGGAASPFSGFSVAIRRSEPDLSDTQKKPSSLEDASKFQFEMFKSTSGKGTRYIFACVVPRSLSNPLVSSESYDESAQ